ncbi:MAG: thioredoxin family protein [Culicoidibacterales bacterium]
MKKMALIVAGMLVLLGAVFFLTNTSAAPTSDIYTYIQEDELVTKIANKESFVVYVYGKTCVYCQKFAPTIEGYLRSNKYQINKIASDDSPNLRQTIGETYQGTPSIYVYENGQIADYSVGQKSEADLAAFVTKNSKTFNTHKVN